MTEFRRQSARPLTARSIRAVARTLRQRLDQIERYAEAQDAQGRARLTRAIHDLSYGAQELSRRHRGMSVIEHEQTRGAERDGIDQAE